MAIMLRTLGVPARNVTGFVGGQLQPVRRLLRAAPGRRAQLGRGVQRGRGWVTYDPTPAARAALGPREGLWSDVHAIIDALRTRWMTQRGRLRPAHAGGPACASSRTGSRRAAAATTAIARARGRELGLRDSLKPALRWELGLLDRARGRLARAAYAAQYDAARGVRPRSKQQAQASHAVRRSSSARSPAAAHPRPPAVTPLEHARTLARQGFAQHADVELVTRSYLEARFGGRPLHAAELTTLKQAIPRACARRRSPAR